MNLMGPQMRSRMNTTGMNVNLRSAFFTTSKAFGVKKSPPGSNPKLICGTSKKVDNRINKYFEGKAVQLITIVSA